MSRVSSGLWQNLIVVQVYGANTGVGKTIFSTLLGSHFTKRAGKTRWNIDYIKPVSTGPSDEADERYVRKYAGHPVSTLFKFDEPVSPHVAARNSDYIPSDDVLNQRLSAKLKNHASACAMGRGEIGVSIIETAGGVLSPGPSGTPQADIYRPLRLPTVLVADHRLGGISSTISAAESLIVRGYDIDAVVCFDDQSKLENSIYLQEYFGKRGISAFVVPWIPDLADCSEQEETRRMGGYYDRGTRAGYMYQVAGHIVTRHVERLKKMKNMASRTRKAIWHPFTQHKSIEKADDVLVFDSAYGDFFQVKHTNKSMQTIDHKAATPLLYPAFDGSASWWTQGLGHGNPQLSLAAAYAAGRYGHIMFAGATHEPALTLAERLLAGMENTRLTKCFYTDDGSTAVEVGIKMALRAACKRYDWDGSTEDIGLLGLKGSYHGDTIGAMDASEPCVYNKKVDWYRGRGYWFDYPTVKMRRGRWIVEPPAGMEADFGPEHSFESLNDVFDNEARGYSPRYEQYIMAVLDTLVKKEGRKFGALVMEPIILGAGGMIFVDPLFQRTLVRVIRNYEFAPVPSPTPPDETTWTGLPILLDEVFTGLYRLGRFSAASFLAIHPDISVHAKLLTGGLLPLSATLASASIFDAFLGDEKADALLHGHSYTAHPIGCHVANTSLQEMEVLSSGAVWDRYRRGWAKDVTAIKVHRRDREKDTSVWSMWSKDLVDRLSHHESVDSVVALGSVLAVSLVDKKGSGYTSTAAVSLREALLTDHAIGGISVHSRVLGNVIYLMASMNSRPAHLAQVEAALLLKLDFVSGRVPG
ncbi:pyridoxal phosphate-dependent transferase [Massariosphaeria phaeospora]|uniref:Pyridoxal phosphate-dependent transferase n=1 Tax=Massariosphaeria phaeospora TaxID=100035 RepID=A0A7C8M7W6_9PLEO|nr:pyridoxal phosphate-dependent transferase [Massariosphaeria phaeospora]